jgi:CO dehydrogenase/acetyl-CoA synthase gamma subunit (corrinoid Fe-S protein)
MLCWIYPHEKKELIKVVNNQFPLVFAKNYDDFCNQINKTDYLILSIIKAKTDLIELKTLLESYQQYKFHFVGHLDSESYLQEEFEILEEENAVSVPYDVNELFLEAIGKIENIFQKRGILVRRH